MAAPAWAFFSFLLGGLPQSLDSGSLEIGKLSFSRSHNIYIAGGWKECPFALPLLFLTLTHYDVGAFPNI